MRAAAALVPAVALAAIALWSVWRIERAGAGVPDDAAWQAAAALVRGQYQPGELIVFAPDWIDPVGRLHLGDLISLDAAGRLDAERYAVIHEVSIRGARAAETRGLRPVWQGEADGVVVRRFERTPATLVTDLVAVADRGAAQVSGAVARGPEVVLAEVGFVPHRCVQVVPAAGGAVTLTFADVALGDALVGGVGLADIFQRRQVRAPVELTVAVDGREVARVAVGVDSGWVRFRGATAPGRATVAVTARAIGDGSRDRQVCFAVEARK